MCCHSDANFNYGLALRINGSTFEPSHNENAAVILASFAYLTHVC